MRNISKGVVVDPNPTTVKIIKEIVVVIIKDEYSLWTYKAR